jgi:hypothetical protein
MPKFSFLIPLLLASPGVAQLDRSSLNGALTDPAGNRIPGAAVAAIQSATGLAGESFLDAQLRRDHYARQSRRDGKRDAQTVSACAANLILTSPHPASPRPFTAP